MANPIEDAKKKQKARVSRTDRELLAMEGGSTKRDAAPAKPAAPAEKTGTGSDNSAENANVLAAQARARIEAMTSNMQSAKDESAKARIQAALAKERAKLAALLSE